MEQESATSGQMPGDEMNPPQTRPLVKTGRVLVLFAQGGTKAGIQALKDSGGINVSTSGEVSSEQENRVYSQMGVAVIKPDPDQLSSIQSASSEFNSPILTMEDEQVTEVNPQLGVQDATTTFSTWGLRNTNVISSTYSGKGIKVAVLDTGFDLKHPDFANREIVSKSFVEGEDVQDGHGHGTHCTGTACGSKNPKDSSTRYGIAYEADIYIGKVLDNQGKGADNSIIAGINWAIEEGCHIISMSIGGFVSLNQSYSSVYETVAYRALQAGTLIVVAAGNDSHRTLQPSIINPVSRPANCPSMMGVGAIDSSFNVASFSNGDINVTFEGAEVDIAAPGVNVYSSWPVNLGKYKMLSGTSMATPHVAGIAALYAQADSTLRGQKLWDQLIKTTKSLNLSETDVGTGLVQGPT